MVEEPLKNVIPNLVSQKKPPKKNTAWNTITKKHEENYDHTKTETTTKIQVRSRPAKLKMLRNTLNHVKNSQNVQK